MHHPAIYRDSLAHHVVACARCKVNSHARHIFVIANAACWHVLAYNISQIPRRLVHFRGKRAGCNAGDKNTVLDQSGRKPLGQTDNGSFRGLVAVCFPGVRPQAVDLGDIDHLGGLLI